MESQQRKPIRHECEQVIVLQELNVEGSVPAVEVNVLWDGHNDRRITLRWSLPDKLERHNLGFHPRQGAEYWEAYEDEWVIELQREFKPGEEISTVVGVKGKTKPRQQLAAEPPTVAVTASGSDPAPSDFTEPQKTSRQGTEGEDSDSGGGIFSTLIGWSSEDTSDDPSGTSSSSVASETPAVGSQSDTAATPNEGSTGSVPDPVADGNTHPDSDPAGGTTPEESNGPEAEQASKGDEESSQEAGDTDSDSNSDGSAPATEQGPEELIADAEEQGSGKDGGGNTNDVDAGADGTTQIEGVNSPKSDGPSDEEDTSGKESSDDDTENGPADDDDGASEQVDTVTDGAVWRTEEMAPSGDDGAGISPEIVEQIEHALGGASDTVALVEDEQGQRAIVARERGDGFRGPELRARVERLEQEVAEVNAYSGALEDLLAKHGDGSGVIEDIKTDVEQVAEGASTLKDEVDDLRGVVATVEEADIDELADDIDDLDERLDSAIDSLQAQTERLSSKSQELETRLDSLTDLPTRVRNLESRVDKMEALESRVHSLEQLEERVESLEEKAERVDELDDHEHRLEDLEDQTERIDDLEDDLAEIDEFRQRMQAALDF